MIERVNSLLCVGLDPHEKQLQSNSAECAAEFCLKIIDQTHPFAAAFKPNATFFEVFGPAGITALIKVFIQLEDVRVFKKYMYILQVIKAIPGDIPVILDVKRGDIDTTAQVNFTRFPVCLIYSFCEGICRFCI